MLRTHALALRAGGRSLIASLDLALAPGQHCALLGRNGAGKSSLILALAGLRAPDAGSVTLDGAPLASHRRDALARKIGVLLQDDAADYWGSTLEYVLLGRYPHSKSAWAIDAEGAARARHWLGELELADHLNQPYRTLSGGERQRARLAQLLLQDPDILLLDEPLNHLDLRHQAQVMKMLAACAQSGKSLLLALHEPGLAARYCDTAVLLYDAGRVSLGRSSEMLTQANLEALYQCRLEAAGDRSFVPS